VKESTVNNFGDIANRFIVACKARSAANVLRSMRCLFRSHDKNQDGLIDPVDFKYGVRNFGIEIGEDELKQLMKYFDTENLGKISLNDILHAIRNGSLNDRR
jgi:Ca2+-binding EF-hand superfamily protein